MGCIERDRDMDRAIDESRRASIHVTVFPFFAFGHINPFIHLSNKLASHGFRISFLSPPSTIPHIRASLTSSPHVSIVPVSVPHVEGLPKGVESTSHINPEMEELFLVAIDKMQPQIRSLLYDLKPDLVIFDFAQMWIPSMASELGIKSVFFFVTTVISMCYSIGIPSRVLSHQLPSTDDLKRAPPGFPNSSLISLKTFEANNLLLLFSRSNGGEGPSLLQRALTGIQGCNVYLHKSCYEMEAPYCDFFQKAIRKPILMAGIPLPPSSLDPLEDYWASWLARFPTKSVVFCSFGSQTYLSDTQIRELALGLELTGLPFLMVLSPTGLDHERLSRALPEGFLERVKERGRIHIGWVPQHQIMAHSSVGCSLNHAGFSSLMEAIATDCQLVLLPFRGDQFLSSKLLSLDIKVGVEVNRRDEDGYFSKDDIFESIKKVTLDADKEPGKSIATNLAHWKELFLSKDFEDKYVNDLVDHLKTLVIA